MSTFVLRNIDLDNVLDIPYSEAAEFKPVELYGDCHGGENQLWRVRNGRIASVIDTDLCLGVLNGVRDEEPIILVGHESGKALTWKWGGGRCDFGNDDYLDICDVIVCSEEASLQIGPAKCGHGIALQKLSSSQQLWKKEEPPALSMDTFGLHNIDRGTYLSITGAVCEFKPVELQELQQGIELQEWQVHEGRMVSTLDPTLCLGVRKIREGERIMMVGLDDENALKWRWGHNESDLGACGGHNGVAIVCVEDPSLRLGPVKGSRNGIELQKLSDLGQLWELSEQKVPSRPASSCHLGYAGIREDDISDTWTLECTVNVRESQDSTYFCVVGWGPGGYSGIQQINSERRVAIFSMWNDRGGCGDVKEVEHGEGVIVSKFGGEGTGFKSMKDVNWKNNEDVTLIVKGHKISSNGEEESWRCSCWLSLGAKSEKQLMATFERRSRERPLSAGGFYSFVEDWDRSRDACGHSARRLAEFSSATVNGRALNEARFTKVETDADAFAASKAMGFCRGERNCFVLSTGGEDVPSGECVCNNSTLRI